MKLVFESGQTGNVCLPLYISHGDMSLGLPEAVFPAPRRIKPTLRDKQNQERERNIDSNLIKLSESWRQPHSKPESP